MIQLSKGAGEEFSGTRDSAGAVGLGVEVQCSKQQQEEETSVFRGPREREEAAREKRKTKYKGFAGRSIVQR